MKTLFPIALALAAGPALAADGGPLGTLPVGAWQCEKPGDAAGPASARTPDEDFAVLTSSSYAVGEARGSYLRTGDTVVMTSGPKQGQKYRRVSINFLRKLDAAGADSDLHCVRSNRNNS